MMLTTANKQKKNTKNVSWVKNMCMTEVGRLCATEFSLMPEMKLKTVDNVNELEVNAIERINSYLVWERERRKATLHTQHTRQKKNNLNSEHKTKCFGSLTNAENNKTGSQFTFHHFHAFPFSYTQNRVRGNWH